MEMKIYIKQARLKLGFTQKKISEIMGVNIKLYQKWEQGSQGISAAPLKFFKLIIVLEMENVLNKYLERINNDDSKKL